jgi:hypothetical protein
MPKIPVSEFTKACDELEAFVEKTKRKCKSLVDGEEAKQWTEDYFDKIVSELRDRQIAFLQKQIAGPASKSRKRASRSEPETAAPKRRAR